MRLRILILMFIGITMAVFAESRKISIKGNVYDRVTTKHLPHVNVKVFGSDTVVAETEAYDETYEYTGNTLKDLETGYYAFEVPVSDRPYTISYTKDGYETLEIPLDLSKLSKREYELKLPPVYMTPRVEQESTQLDEVVVKATKIKFYHKGDTIVYNADAFMLPQGSTLDALIAKLPGVEIREGGKIYVNGRYVESLLLNGKDFFKGNQDVLRENLGAYAVKDIAVYDKYGQMSKLMDTKLEDDKQYVMDVRLKKEYMGGFLGNFEASYGTDDRFSGRLFAMHFNNNARFSIYGNYNNVNNMGRPSDGEGYQFSATNRDGIAEIANGGFDYHVEDPRKTWEVGGNVDISHIDKNIVENVFEESFLSSNIYKTTLSNMRSKSFNISTQHHFEFNKEFYFLKVNPKFYYSRTRSETGSSEVSFDKNMQEEFEINRALIDAIYSNSELKLREAIINRNRFMRKNRSNKSMAYLWTEQAIRFKGSPDALNIWVEGEYDRDHSEDLTRRQIDYGFNGVDAPRSSTAIVRNSRSYPAYEGWIKGAARYFLKSRKATYTVGYEYRHERHRKSSYQFMFDSYLQDEEALLPDMSDLSPDLSNTNSSKLIANIHMIKGSFEYRTDIAKGYKFIFSVRPEFHIRHRNLSYNAYENSDGGYQPVTIPVGRTSVSFNNSSMTLQLNTPDYKTYYYLGYDFRTNYAPLPDMIDIPNTTDPLNIYHGNPDLKDAFIQSVSLSINSSFAKNTNIWIYSDFTYTSRDIVKGYSYDMATGIRDYYTLNASGNLSESTNAQFSKTFGFGNHELALTPNLSYAFRRFANLLGEDGPMKKQVVYSNMFGYGMTVRYTLMGKYALTGGIIADNNFSRTNSDIRGNTVQRRIRPMVSLNLQLPFGFSFNTVMDYTILKGSANRDMENSWCLLNADIRYQLNKNWSFTVRGYDLLNQMKPYSNVISSTGRIQTITNTLPRYVMLTVGYKFNTRKK